mmetsp:Transcript_2674/g.8003  ORF Transcript_2674/g.8003 Transcript_2674/m.8003 type:complete len:245 (-) Transcript_2674:177-911(-)
MMQIPPPQCTNVSHSLFPRPLSLFLLQGTSGPLQGDRLCWTSSSPESPEDQLRAGGRCPVEGVGVSRRAGESVQILCGLTILLHSVTTNESACLLGVNSRAWEIHGDHRNTQGLQWDSLPIFLRSRIYYQFGTLADVLSNDRPPELVQSRTSRCLQLGSHLQTVRSDCIIRPQHAIETGEDPDFFLCDVPFLRRQRLTVETSVCGTIHCEARCLAGVRVPFLIASEVLLRNGTAHAHQAPQILW